MHSVTFVVLVVLRLARTGHLLTEVLNESIFFGLHLVSMLVINTTYCSNDSLVLCF